MKTLFIIPALILGSLPAVAARDHIILPNLYAREFCELRDSGVPYDDAVSAAVRASVVPGEPVATISNGSETTVDVVRAASAVMRRCPYHIQ